MALIIWTAADFVDFPKGHVRLESKSAAKLSSFNGQIVFNVKGYSIDAAYMIKNGILTRSTISDQPDASSFFHPLEQNIPIKLYRYNLFTLSRPYVESSDNKFAISSGAKPLFSNRCDLTYLVKIDLVTKVASYFTGPLSESNQRAPRPFEYTCRYFHALALSPDKKSIAALLRSSRKKVTPISYFVSQHTHPKLATYLHKYSINIYDVNSGKLVANADLTTGIRANVTSFSWLN